MARYVIRDSNGREGAPNSNGEGNRGAVRRPLCFFVSYID